MAKRSVFIIQGSTSEESCRGMGWLCYGEGCKDWMIGFRQSWRDFMIGFRQKLEGLDDWVPTKAGGTGWFSYDESCRDWMVGFRQKLEGLVGLVTMKARGIS